MLNKNKTALYSVSKNILLTIFFAIFAMIFALNLLYVFQVSGFDFGHFGRQAYGVIVIAIVLMLAIGYLCFKLKISNKILLLALLIYAGIVCLQIYNFQGVTMRLADSRTIDELAKIFAGSDNSTTQAFLSGTDKAYLASYISKYAPHQLPLVLFIAFLYKIFGTQPDIMVLVNSVAVLIVIISLYGISNRLFKNDNVTRATLLLLFLALPLYYYATYFYNDIIAISLYLLSFWLLLIFCDKRRLRYLILAGLILGLGIAMRMTGLIFAVAMVIVLIANIMQNRLRPLPNLIKIFVFVALLPVANILFSLSYGYYNAEKPVKTMPTISYVAMGLQIGSPNGIPGWWNRYNFECIIRDLKDDSFDCSKDSIKEINNSLSTFLDNPTYAAEFFVQKTSSQWTDGSFVTDSYFGVYASKDNVYLVNAMWLAMVFSVLVLTILRRKQITLLQLAVATVIIGGFLFSLFWEAKSRYNLPYYLMTFPFAAAGIYYGGLKFQVFKNKLIFVFKNKVLVSKEIPSHRSASRD